MSFLIKTQVSKKKLRAYLSQSRVVVCGMGVGLNKVIHSACFLFGAGRCGELGWLGLRGQLKKDAWRLVVLAPVALGGAGPRTV